MFLKPWRPRYKHVLSSAFALLYNAPASHPSSYYMLRSPPPSSPRELATPLVFVSSKEWDGDSTHGMPTFATMFAERGYTTLEVDISLPALKATTSDELLHYLETELTSQVRLGAIPFAPVLFARSGGTLIAQTYVSSNPVSGLVLICPPTSTSSQTATRLLPSPLREFDYEPRFPLLIVDTPTGMKEQAAANRLVRDENVDTVSLSNLDGMGSLMAIEKWMDSVGV